MVPHDYLPLQTKDLTFEFLNSLLNSEQSESTSALAQDSGKS